MFTIVSETATKEKRWFGLQAVYAIAAAQVSGKFARTVTACYAAILMQRLTQAPNLAIATLWADALEREGIATSLQRTFLTGGAGDLPPDQCLPEIWITESAQFDRARELLHALQNIPQRRWRCTCGELVEGGFEQCWNCGALMPS